MTNRILISSQRIAISRPGYDVIYSAPSYETMVFDTGLPEIERPLMAGTIFAKSVNDRYFHPYGVTYDIPPVVLCQPYTLKVAINEPMLYQRMGAGSNAYDLWQTSFVIDCYHHGFAIVPADGVSHFWRNHSYDWAYSVWAIPNG